jgi:hypothetical protein
MGDVTVNRIVSPAVAGVVLVMEVTADDRAHLSKIHGLWPPCSPGAVLPGLIHQTVSPVSYRLTYPLTPSLEGKGKYF